MDTKHTPEPWKTDGSDVTADGVWIGQFGWDDYPEDKDGANAEHAVACVNACAGIEDPSAALGEVRRVLADIQRNVPGVVSWEAGRMLALLGNK